VGAGRWRGGGRRGEWGTFALFDAFSDRLEAEMGVAIAL
jgi:hypothetical protein